MACLPASHSHSSCSRTAEFLAARVRLCMASLQEFVAAENEEPGVDFTLGLALSLVLGQGFLLNDLRHLFSSVCLPGLAGWGLAGGRGLSQKPPARPLPFEEAFLLFDGLANCWGPAFFLRLALPRSSAETGEMNRRRSRSRDRNRPRHINETSQARNRN